MSALPTGKLHETSEPGFDGQSGPGRIWILDARYLVEQADLYALSRTLCA